MCRLCLYSSVVLTRPCRGVGSCASWRRLRSPSANRSTPSSSTGNPDRKRRSSSYYTSVWLSWVNVGDWKWMLQNAKDPPRAARVVLLRLGQLRFLHDGGYRLPRSLPDDRNRE